jgi:IS30 family transposase
MSGKYLTLKDRRLIAKRYNEEARVLDIANEIGCHPATIYEELRRGATGRLDARQRPEYDPLIAQRAVQEAIRRRGNRRTAKAQHRDC